MPKFDVQAIYTTSKYIGTFEADSAEEAEDMAEQAKEFSNELQVCHNCADRIGGNDISFDRFTSEVAE